MDPLRAYTRLAGNSPASHRTKRLKESNKDMSSQVILKNLTERNIIGLKKIFDSSGPFVAVRSISDYWLYARLFNNTCIIAKDNDVLVGALLAFCDQTRSYKEIYIQDVVVLPEYQNKGIGTLLLEEFIDRAKALNIGRVWLTSEAENRNAMKLWEKLGFVNHEADYIKEGLWVTKDLKGPGRDRVVYSLDVV